MTVGISFLNFFKSCTFGKCGPDTKWRNQKAIVIQLSKITIQEPLKYIMKEKLKQLLFQRQCGVQIKNRENWRSEWKHINLEASGKLKWHPRRRTGVETAFYHFDLENQPISDYFILHQSFDLKFSWLLSSQQENRCNCYDHLWKLLLH